MNKQFCIIIDEAVLPIFSATFPTMKFIEVMGMPIKDDQGKEFLAMVMPMPVPLAPPEPAEPSEPSKIESQDAPQAG